LASTRKDAKAHLGHALHPRQQHLAQDRPQGIYPADATKFVLRFVGDKMQRVWETLPNGTDFATARKLCLEKELALASPPEPKPDGSCRLAQLIPY
jgi:hypothetical protein